MTRRTAVQRAARAASFALAALIAAACSQSPAPTGPAPSPGPAPAPAPAPMHTYAAFPGFDTGIYPGDAAMRAWKDASPYTWVGYYLAAPCHRDDGWMGKRATLQAMGWGMAVVYVGQQTWGLDPSAGAAHGATCSAGFLSADRGARDARAAAARAAAEGFDPGTVVFLDLEYMDTVPRAMRDYYQAWTAEMLRDGRFVPGVYVHTRNADLVHDDLRAVFAAAGKTMDPPFWIAGGSGFSTESPPSGVGHDFAAVWQGILDVVETRGTVRLPIDVNVASVPSPSSPEFAQGE